MLISLLTLSCAVASDASDNLTIDDNSESPNEITEKTDTPVTLNENDQVKGIVQSAEDSANLSKVKTNDAPNIVKLSNDLNYDQGEYNLNFYESNIIEGENYTIEGENSKIKIEVSDKVNLTFKNINFKDIELTFTLSDLKNTNITLMDCSFTKEKYDNQLTVDEFKDEVKYSSEITPEIEKLAFSIVGTSTDIEAAQKLANWVKTNIAHETNDGFYQSPSETLKRKMGNCCCHSELFLLMCDAIGITQNHEVCFVQVGCMGFGYRHYFTLIDNICVDTDGSKDDPWAYGGGLDWGVYQITKYPLLPYNA